MTKQEALDRLLLIADKLEPPCVWEATSGEYLVQDWYRAMTDLIEEIYETDGLIMTIKGKDSNG